MATQGEAGRACPSSQGAALVQSLWVRPVPRERVLGVPVAAEGFERWRVLGRVSRALLPWRVPDSVFNPNQEKVERHGSGPEMPGNGQQGRLGGASQWSSRGCFSLFIWFFGRPSQVAAGVPRTGLTCCLVFGGRRWLVEMSNDMKR